jgi:hypothetical protein
MRRLQNTPSGASRKPEHSRLLGCGAVTGKAESVPIFLIFAVCRAFASPDSLAAILRGGCAGMRRLSRFTFPAARGRRQHNHHAPVKKNGRTFSDLKRFTRRTPGDREI